VARKSEELNNARKMGAVSVRYVERCKMTKDPTPPRPLPPSVRMSRPNRGGMMKKTAAPEEETPTGVSEEDIRHIIREEMREEDIRRIIREEMREAMRGVVGQPAPVNVVVDAKTLQEALAGSNPGRGVTPKAPEDEPVYIPTDIVDKSAKADIQTEKKADKADSLDAAAAALKKTAPKKKRKPRKKKATTKSEE